MFNNRTIKSTFDEFNGSSFAELFGFGIYSSSDTVFYYVINYGANKVYILNDEWELISFKTFFYPAYMISIGNSLYMTGDVNLWKVDQDLNILINYKPTGGYPDYRGISNSPSNGLIYVAACELKEIQVFNLDLNFIRRLSTEPHQPWSIAESSNQFYVGTKEGMILVYQNEIIIKQFNGCNGNSNLLSSILFDQNGYMATCCDNDKLYLFSPNGSFTGKSLRTPYIPLHIGFDSKGQLIQILENQITIYK